MSTGQSYLEDTTADAVLLQELRVCGGPLLAAQRRAARAKWSLAAEPAVPTEAGSLSAGVGVAARSHVGLSRAAGLVSRDACHPRVVVTHAGAFCAGGIYLVSAYFWCNEGASQRDLELLQCIAQRVRQLHGPWILAADFNFPPAVLESTGWLRLAGGAIVSTGLATCKGAAEDDHFVVDARLRGAIVGVALVHDAGSRPRSAVRIWVKGRPRRDVVRSLAAPAKADITQSLGTGASAQVVARARRVQWFFLAYSWEYLGDGVHAAAFRRWVRMAASQGWQDRVRVNWLRSTADLISRRTMAYDIQQSDAAWASWLCDGPCKSLGRHHRLSRVASSWAPSPISNGEPDGDALSEAADDDCLSQRELDGCEACCSPRPLSLQAELAATALQTAARTFSAGTGPGWDKLGPRAVCRCADGAIWSLIRLFIMCELLGTWPTCVGVVLICLLPKPDGGRRPIGLLPSVIRWWMRARLDVVRAWQPAHDRLFFYAGPRRGAEVAAWKQAARAELAHCASFLSHANAMLDMVKGWRYSYPMAVLRLSVAACRLARCIAIDGVCSVLLLAARGITAGAVRATFELRLLLVEWLDGTVALYRCIVITVYVDDASFEASGSDRMVCDAVGGAVRHFAERLVEIGMEVSPTKNMVLASLKVVDNAKSLGGAICPGRVRHAALLAKRLRAFKVRKPQFRKLRRWIGARRAAAVLRTGGAAALVHGQANAGVSNTMVQSQRVAVAAASVPGGRGELDLALILADGGVGGKADPAFAAHEAPTVKWAEAVWEGWLPRPALNKLVSAALAVLVDRASPWAMVRGPAAAFAASALRIGWQILSHAKVRTDRGQHIDFTRDSPAMARRFAPQSVWRWRWRRVERQHPRVARGPGGHGLFVQLIFKLLNGRGGDNWGPSEKGALRSAFANRQWPQARLHRAGLASTANCRLCARAGLCDPQADDPRFTGHLARRVFTCPATEPYRQKTAPAWIQELVRQHTDAEGTLALSPADLALLTRGVAPSPAAALGPLAAHAANGWSGRARWPR
ncbi:unnamed protein product, partial [Prorocentrum cordatum]